MSLMAQPIDLYYWPTPNGCKITIFLEEAGLPYELVPVDITSGEQYESEFLRISPNNKIPAIVDPDGPDGEPISLSESGAILIYLAEKTGKFIPESPRDKVRDEHEPGNYLCVAIQAYDSRGNMVMIKNPQPTKVFRIVDLRNKNDHKVKFLGWGD